MPGPETVPPDSEDVRVSDENAKRPGAGVPGEDATVGPRGRHGERQPGGTTAGTVGEKGDRDIHEEAKAAAPYMKPGDNVPGRRVSDTGTTKEER